MLSAVLAAQQIPARSALSVRGVDEALIGVAEHVTPAVAMVIAEGYQQVAGDPARVIPFGLRRAGGSGVIVSSNGYIVYQRARHRRATRIQVQLSSNGTQAGRSIVRPPGRLLAAPAGWSRRRNRFGPVGRSRPRVCGSWNCRTPILFGRASWSSHWAVPTASRAR